MQKWRHGNVYRSGSSGRSPSIWPYPGQSRAVRAGSGVHFMSSLLITGGAGFIGSNLVDYALAHTTDRIVVVDKVTYAANPQSIEAWRSKPRVTFVRGDIADRPLIERVVAEHGPRDILNLAAETHVDRSIDS